MDTSTNMHVYLSCTRTKNLMARCKIADESLTEILKITFQTLLFIFMIRSFECAKRGLHLA